jgi:hypothetical protein
MRKTGKKKILIVMMNDIVNLTIRLGAGGYEVVSADGAGCFFAHRKTGSHPFGYPDAFGDGVSAAENWQTSGTTRIPSF